MKIASTPMLVNSMGNAHLMAAAALLLPMATASKRNCASRLDIAVFKTDNASLHPTTIVQPRLLPVFWGMYLRG